MGELNEPVLDLDAERPRTRGDCQPGGPKFLRPCPFISCRHHLADVRPTIYKGQLRVVDALVPTSPKARDGEEAVEQAAEAVVSMKESCALDVVERAHSDETTLQEVGDAMGVTRERIRQIESKGVTNLTHSLRRRLRMR